MIGNREEDFVDVGRGPGNGSRQEDGEIGRRNT